MPQEPPFPESLRYLWRWFKELADGRTTGFGTNPITYTDIEAWSRLYGVQLTRWEVGLIKDLDLIYLLSRSSDEDSLVEKSDE